MHLGSHCETSLVSTQDVVSCHHPGEVNAPTSWSQETQAEGQDPAARAAAMYGSFATCKSSWLGPSVPHLDPSPFGAEAPKPAVLRIEVQLKVLPTAGLPQCAAPLPCAGPGPILPRGAAAGVPRLF